MVYTIKKCDECGKEIEGLSDLMAERLLYNHKGSHHMERYEKAKKEELKKSTEEKQNENKSSTDTYC